MYNCSGQLWLISMQQIIKQKISENEESKVIQHFFFSWACFPSTTIIDCSKVSICTFYHLYLVYLKERYDLYLRRWSSGFLYIANRASSEIFFDFFIYLNQVLIGPSRKLKIFVDIGFVYAEIFVSENWLPAINDYECIETSIFQTFKCEFLSVLYSTLQSMLVFPPCCPFKDKGSPLKFSQLSAIICRVAILWYLL